MVLLEACVRLLPGVMGKAEVRRTTRALRTGCSNTRNTPGRRLFEGRTIPRDVNLWRSRAKSRLFAAPRPSG